MRLNGVRLSITDYGGYRGQVAKLCEVFADPDRRERAVEVTRGLVDGIDLVPIEEGGKLAGILALGAGVKKPLNESGFEMRVTTSVAGPEYLEAAIGQQILDVSEAQCEAAIKPYGVLDDLGWE